MPVNGGNTVQESPNEVALSYINMVDDTMDNIVSTIMNGDTNVMYFVMLEKTGQV